jgi:hypothetical protein
VPGWLGYVVGIEKVLSTKEDRVLRCHQLLNKRQQREKDKKTVREEVVELVL